MAIGIVDRLTAAIRIAETSRDHAQRHVDHANWTEILRTLQDARDELQKPLPSPGEAIDHFAAPPIPTKLDGRTKEARALKAQQ